MLKENALLKSSHDSFYGGSGLKGQNGNNGQNGGKKAPHKGPEKYENINAGFLVRFKDHTCPKKKCLITGRVREINRLEDKTPKRMIITVIHSVENKEWVGKDITLKYQQIKRKNQYGWILEKIEDDAVRIDYNHPLDLQLAA